MYVTAVGKLCHFHILMLLQIECDRTYQFPKESIKALGDMGLLGLIIPKEMGGLGQNHVCAAMVVETLARYGCPSTAMIFSESYSLETRKSDWKLVMH